MMIRSNPCTVILDKLELREVAVGDDPEKIKRDRLLEALRTVRTQQLADGQYGLDESTNERTRCWSMLAGVPDFQAQFGPEASSSAYQQLLQASSSSAVHVEAIEKDVHRTFPRGRWAQLWQEGNADRSAILTRILTAYAVWNRRDGYAQGMNFIAGLLVVALGKDNEEEIFWIFVCVLHRFGLCSLFSTVSPTLQYCLETFSFELEHQSSRLFDHFTAEGIQPWMFATEWLTTVFVYNLPPETAIPVFELFLLDGIKAIFSVGLSLLEQFQDDLLQWNMEQLLTRFKGRLAQVNGQRLTRAATRLQLSRQTVASVRQFVVRSRGKGFDLPAPSLACAAATASSGRTSRPGSNNDMGRDRQQQYQLTASAPLPIAAAPRKGDDAAVSGSRSVTPPTRRMRVRTARGAAVPTVIARSPTSGTGGGGSSNSSSNWWLFGGSSPADGTSPSLLSKSPSGSVATSPADGLSAEHELLLARNRIAQLEGELRDAIERDRAHAVQIACLQGALAALKANDPAKFSEGVERAADLSRTSSSLAASSIASPSIQSAFGSTSSSVLHKTPSLSTSPSSSSPLSGAVDGFNGSGSTSSRKARIIQALHQEMIDMERHYLAKILELVDEVNRLKSINDELERKTEFSTILGDLKIESVPDQRPPPSESISAVYRFQPRRPRGQTATGPPSQKNQPEARAHRSRSLTQK